MTFQVGDIVRMTRGDDTTYCVLETSNEYGVQLVKIDHPTATGWWEHGFFTLATGVKDDPRTAEALAPKAAPPDPAREPDPVLVSLNEKLTLAAVAVIEGDRAAVELITDALADVRTALEQ